ncbi:hypothetical protein MKS88_005304 [Plasmodium brasilianum]|uniref:PIR Superfamily Protein n=2 Tax=Plasmodium (Plasmodium) TaxID=418103 RepID=A0A1C3L219_PLAMA|nr:conserved Plasmodium protein, unknown function [Plasmodium malariae]KAI4834630.1 hypothetical protein MKS88_005304 [Plasmodium brasilianum]SBT80587.1 conserved Plasmodium protein, unknown function [Plasmodium malariae]SCP03170.1 conserved Plasmodium protein, unknown function [Plasmodium malariae]
MPHHLTSFVAALTGSISSGTCCGCIPFTFSPAVTPAIASSTAPISATIPNTVVPAAVASQSAITSTPVLGSVVAFFAPYLSFYKKCNIFEETKESPKKVDKMCQCNLISADELNYQSHDMLKEQSYLSREEIFEKNTDNEHCSSDNETVNNCNLNIKEEIIKEELNLLDHEKSFTSSEYSMHSFLEDAEMGTI